MPEHATNKLIADESLTAVRDALTLLFAVVGLSCTVGIATPRNSQSASTSLVVVEIKAPISRSAANALRPDRDVVTVLSRTKLEVWRLVNPADGPAARLRADPRVAFVEEMAGVVAAVPIETVDLEQLSDGDRSTVNQLTKGAEPGAIRVTAGRPAHVTMDLLESALASTVVMPLLDRELPTFTRTSVDPIGAEGFSWSGRLASGIGELTLIVRPLGVTGTVRYDRQVYSVWPLASGRHLIRRAGPFPRDHPRPFAHASAITGVKR